MSTCFQLFEKIRHKSNDLHVLSASSQVGMARCLQQEKELKREREEMNYNVYNKKSFLAILNLFSMIGIRMNLCPAFQKRATHF